MKHSIAIEHDDETRSFRLIDTDLEGYCSVSETMEEAVTIAN